MHIRLKWPIGQLRDDVIYIQLPESARQCDAFKCKLQLLSLNPSGIEKFKQERKSEVNSGISSQIAWEQALLGVRGWGKEEGMERLE